jgi:hypothetical protein
MMHVEGETSISVYYSIDPKKESNTANRQIFQSKKNVMVNVLKK